MEIYFFGENNLDIKNILYLPDLFENNISGDEKCIIAFESINSRMTNIPVIIKYNDFFYLKMNHRDLPIHFENKNDLKKFLKNIYKY